MGLRKQMVLVIVILIILDIIAVYLSNVTANPDSSESRPFSVSEVYEHSLLGDYVYVKGRITEVLEDHVSEKGFVYQEFIISDGEEDIRIFCSVKYGRSEINEGDEILFNGEFKEYYQTYEIYGFCSEIKILYFGL